MTSRAREIPLSTRHHCQGVLALVAAVCAAPLAAAPEVARWTTETGARVLFVETHEIPAVDARLTFAAGAARDGDHPGIARLTSQLLMSGTQALDADALARAYEDEGAEVSTGAARDMAWVELRSLSAEAHLRPVAETVASIVARPAFPEGEVERLIGQQRTALQQQAQSPGALAQRAFWRSAYGDHPYGHEPLGTPESLDAITRADIRAFHERFYVAENVTVAIVGDLSRARAERLARTLTADLPSGEAAPKLPPVPALEQDVTEREAFPSTQAHVLLGLPAVQRGHPQWPAIHVANHVLGGGGFSSRLVSQVREERGLVYGVRSRVSPMSAAGPFMVALQTRGDQAEQALEIVRAELDRFLAEGPSADEIEDAVRNISGGFPLNIDSNAEIASYLSMIGFYDLPTDYLQTFRERVEAVGPDDAHEAFTDAVGGRPAVTVVVGGDRARGDGADAQ